MYVLSTIVVLRAFFLIVLVAFVFQIINPDGSISIQKLQNFESFRNIKEENYNINLKDRRPLERMKDFYQKQEQILKDHLINTRLQFKAQHFVGSVMRDGFHSDLPSNAMWQGHKVVMGKEIEQIRKKEIEKGEKQYASPPPPPSPPSQ